MEICRHALASSRNQRLRHKARKLLRSLSLLVVCLLGGGMARVSDAAALQGLYVGAEAPGFSLKDLNGRQRALAEIAGKKLTMVIFWSTWSGNSEKVLARAQKLYARYQGKGLAVVAVNVDGQQLTPAAMQAITAMAGTLGLKYQVLLDPGLAVFHDYGVIALPSTVILDPARTIRYELSGYPLVGAEQMTDFVVAQIEGRQPSAIVQRKGYQAEKNALRFYQMGKKAQQSKRTDATAETWFLKAAAADPRFMLPHISLGRLYLAQGRPSQAKEQFDLVLRKEPDNVVTLCELGMLLVGEKKLAEGKNLLLKAMAVEASYTPCLYYLGYAYGKMGKMTEALTMFARALAMNPMDLDIFVYKGRMYEEMGKSAEASAAYREALALALSR